MHKSFNNKANDIDLLTLWKVVINYKVLIFIITIFVSVVSIYFYSKLPVKYYSEVLIAPSASPSSAGSAANIAGGIANSFGLSVGNLGADIGVKGEQALAQLKTKSFLVKFINKENIKPVLFPDLWDSVKKKWIDREPSDLQSYYLLNDMITAKKHKNSPAGLATLRIEWENPTNLKSIVYIANKLIIEINDLTKKQEILNAKKQIDFLKKELGKTDILDLKVVLNNLIEKNLSIVTIANVSNEYVFSVLDEAYGPIKIHNISVKLFSFLSVLMGLFIAIVVLLYIDFVRRKETS